MSERDSGLSTSRRAFLKLATLGVASAGALAVTGASEAEAMKAPEENAAGYRETAHVRAYYDLARF